MSEKITGIMFMSSISSYLWLCTSDTLGHCAKNGLSMFAIDESKPIQSLADIYGGGGCFSTNRAI